ncbi:MAG TPA: FCD domain-containing protein [Anaerolineales bacterium]|nr:FCD domain-containing protein [Anaerolineales bacterium]HNB36265.1 FCD domain-containing protein [Anaerolineales bacterium]HNC08406.1 FCD domain-containing protein [Anaerolineales bacterium]
MLRERISPNISEFLRYLASHPEADDKLPSLNDLSRELNISLASLREQLEVARALGFVEVRQKTGTRRLTYSFTPAIRQSLGYALALNDEHFRKFAEMRNHLEAAYWDEAVRLLTDADKAELNGIIARAWEKLQGTPVQVPHEEHRKLHLTIYNRLDNPFVIGILEAYWEAYEAVGLNVFAGGYEYLQEVWRYHQRMVESICSGQFEVGYEALVRHTDLLYHRP